MAVEPVAENKFFGDDAQYIASMLKSNWSLGPNDTPNIVYLPEEFMKSARKALIYVYQISRYNSVSSVDYSTAQRTSFLAIRTSCGDRVRFFRYVNEIYRILLANRRLGQKEMEGYTYFEIINDRSSNDLSGWYQNTLDIKMTSYNFPIKSAGFGDRINREIEDLNEQ